MTLGNAASVRVRLIVCCLDSHHQVEPTPPKWLSAMARRRPSRIGTPRLVCGRRGADALIWW
jgi:hypothetical protein